MACMPGSNLRLAAQTCTPAETEGMDSGKGQTIDTLSASSQKRSSLAAASTASRCLRPALFARQRYRRAEGSIYPAGMLGDHE